MENPARLSVEIDRHGIVPAGKREHASTAEYFVVSSYRVVEPVPCAGRAMGHTCVPALVIGARLCPVGHSLIPAGSVVMAHFSRSIELPGAVASGSQAA